MELTKDEELALLDVLGKEINRRIDELKSDAKRNLFESHDAFGSDRIAITVNGEKVGEVSLNYTGSRIDINPGEELRAIEYLSSCKLTQTVPAKDWQDSFKRLDNGDIVCEKTGEIVNDLFVYYPSVVNNASVRIQNGKAIAALRPKLQDVTVTNLLEA